MKKFAGLFLVVVSVFLIAAQFSGRQSISGLGVASLFTAPASGIYFIDGKLSLPQQSQVVATISKNGVTTIYVGTAGATGFGMPQVTLGTNDAITVNVSSSASVDQGLGKVKGDVFFGNAF